MSRKFLVIAGAAVVALMLGALGDVLDGTPRASAEPFSISYDLVLDDTTGTSSGNGDGNADAGENPDVISTFSRDTADPAVNESYFGLANTVFTGLDPGTGANEGAEVGTIAFNIENNLTKPLTNNIDLATGQPPRCGAGATINVPGFILYESDLDDTNTVSHEDTDSDGFRQTEQDLLDADGNAGSNGIYDGVDLMPEALANTVIPSLGFGDPISRSFGVAPVSTTLGVTTDVHFLTYDLTANPDVAGYLSLSLIGYPGLAADAPSAANVTDQTVVTCPPFSTTVTIYGVSQDNTTECAGDGCTSGTSPNVSGGDAIRTVSGSGTQRIDSSTSDNYDGDAAPNSLDTCRDTVSIDTDVPGVGTDPDSDRWDSACDADPASDDNDGDGTTGPYVTSPPFEPDQDVDGDDVLNTVDNCPFTANSLQTDTDTDGVGDACDPDDQIAGSGAGYSIDAHPHGFPGSPAGYQDHDDRCFDDFTEGAAEGAGDGTCTMTGADGIEGTADDGEAWVDSDDDSIDPDWYDANGNTVYDSGELIDTDSDADADGESDACEAVNGTDPLDPSSNSGTTGLDCDGGGAPDSWEEAALAASAGLDFTSAADDGQDTDSDGCTDAEEAQPDPSLGGGRDYTNPLDFYDITNITGVLGAKDKGISGFDLNLLLGWIGASAGSSPYDDDANSNTIIDGEEVDFASIAGPGTGPDGGVSGFDLNQMLGELGSSCAAPPN